MRVLFDEGTPLPLRKFLREHQIDTVQGMGWSSATDEQLLERIDGVYDLFITTDRNLRHQQNLTHRKIAILVLFTPSWPKLNQHIEEISQAIRLIAPGEIKEWNVLPTL